MIFRPVIFQKRELGGEFPDIHFSRTIGDTLQFYNKCIQVGITSANYFHAAAIVFLYYATAALLNKKRTRP